MPIEAERKVGPKEPARRDLLQPKRSTPRPAKAPPLHVLAVPRQPERILEARNIGGATQVPRGAAEAVQAITAEAEAGNSSAGIAGPEAAADAAPI